MSDDPTTGRARRQQAVDSGATDNAVDRVPDRYDPGGNSLGSTSRQRQQRLAREVASQTDIEREGVGTVDRIGGMDVFLRSSGAAQFGQNVSEQFAGEADYVTQQDVAPNVNAQEIRADPVVAQGRRDDVAERARTQTAADAQFIVGDDLDAEVGARGVTGLEVAADRRDDVERRAEQGLASEDPFAEPGDFDADVSASGIESAGLTDQGARRRAGRQFESETPLTEVDPTDDVTQSDDTFALDTGAQRRIAARQFESDLSLFGSGELNASEDIRQTDDGFGLARDPARELAAANIDARTDRNVTPDDITLTESDDGGFEAVFGGGR